MRGFFRGLSSRSRAVASNVDDVVSEIEHQWLAASILNMPSKTTQAHKIIMVGAHKFDDPLWR